MIDLYPGDVAEYRRRVSARRDRIYQCEVHQVDPLKLRVRIAYVDARNTPRVSWVRADKLALLQPGLFRP